MAVVPVLRKKMSAIVTALDAWLIDPNKCDLITDFPTLTTGIDPWSQETNSPYMTYMWEEGEIKHDALVTATLQIMVVCSAETERGPMHILTNFIEELIQDLFDIDIGTLGARDNENKPVRVTELRPVKFILEPSITERARAHIGYVRCTVNFTLR